MKKIAPNHLFYWVAALGLVAFCCMGLIYLNSPSNQFGTDRFGHTQLDQNEIRSLTFEWTSTSQLTKNTTAPWQASAHGQILVLKNDSYYTAIVLDWTGKIIDPSLNTVFKINKTSSGPLAALAQWGFLDRPLTDAHSLEPQTLPTTLSRYPKEKGSAPQLGDNLMASILDKTLWVTSPQKLVNQDSIFETSESEAGLNRKMNCQFFLKESLKTQCQIKGSLGGETLFESQEILTLSHIKTFPISASDMNKIILKLSEMRQQIPIQDISPGRYQTQTGKADLKHITVEDPTTQNKQMDKEAHQIALAIAELDDHSSQTSKTNLYLKIKQILTSSKTVPQEWTDALSRAQIGSNELQILAGAFAASQSPAAQRALIQIAKESGLTQKATQLVTLLGFTQHPTADTISSLSDYVKNLNLSPVKFQGLLALGILGNADNALGANSKSEIHQTIHQALASPSLDEQKSALAALGNMADSEAIQRIIGFVSSPSAALRQQAVTSLRKARWELVSAEFERALLDVDDGVVLAALRSLESMTAGQIEISQAVSRAMSKWKPTDHAEAIWQMGFKSILRHGHNARDVKQILSQLSQSLRSESLRQTALALLSS